MSLLIAPFAVAALWGCSASVSVGTKSDLAKADVEAQTATQLAAKTNQPKPTITCPGNLAAKVGATMDCTLVAQGDTTQLPVHLTVDSISGGTAHWNIQVGAAPTSGKAAFCADNAKLDKATAGITAVADLVTALKANQAVLDDFEKNAPADIQADATALVGAARSTISTGDASAFGAQAVLTAGGNVNNYCGQNNDGTPATTTIPGGAPTTAAPSDTTTAAP